MSPAELHLPEESTDPTMEDIQRSLRRLERRDWWLWLCAVLVMLALTAAVVSFSFPILMRDSDWFFRFHINQAVSGLVGLVLLFNIYTIYQQVLIKRLRRQLAEQIEVMARLQNRAEEFHKLATRDPLTGLYNRRFAEQRLAGESNRSQRYGHPLTLLIIDLNNFKRINDRYGHPAGDQVLKEFAARLNAVLRASDLPARIGGDEFMVLLPECRPEQLPNLLARLHPFEVNFRGKRILVSFASGWAGYQKGEQAEQLIERADLALYADKRAAQNAAQPAPAAS
jgi:diguanylate cyclase (GGDEF)-like protein